VEFLEQLGSAIAGLPPWAGFVAIVLATFVSEDLTCIGAGLLAARGDVSPAWAIGAAALGIWIGDLLLYWAGHAIGRPALRKAPIAWFVHEEEVVQSEQWFAHRGAAAILIGRAVPGSRLPTYFTAGLLDLGVLRFALYAGLAVALWAPLLGGGALLLGWHALSLVEVYETWALPALLGVLFTVLVAIKFVVPLVTWRGRRIVAGRLRRITHWEFWPPWVFYPPVLLYFLWLALRYRSLSLFTAVNPGFPAGGFIGESKVDIIERIAAEPGVVVRTRRIWSEFPPERKVELVQEFMAEHHLAFPVVLKPDAGQRGSGVKIARSADDLRSWFDRMRVDAVVQEYATGEEFGVFYYREPDQDQGRIFSITRKVFPEVVGDGTRTLEALILADERAACMARLYMERNAHRLWEVPAAGERVRLTDVGNHCRGTIFFDGTALRTPAMEEVFDRLSKSVPDFYFGRYDVFVPCAEDLQDGRNIKVIELNGATAEATSIYDPKNGLFDAYRVLFEQWRILFRIAQKNRERGAAVVPWQELLRLLGDYRRMARSHP
jgi:membrane protein DedA with SNARE-associated domain